MIFSRRAFVRSVAVGAGGALSSAYISARGREALMGARLHGLEASLLAAEADQLILSSNENPVGASPAVLNAVRSALGTGGPGGRYPFAQLGMLTEAIAAKFGVKAQNVFVGCGSTQLLRSVTQLQTSKTRALVAAIPTYEECASYATLMGSAVIGVPLDGQRRADLDATLKAAQGAGLVFYCNPNNPTATVHSAGDTNAFITRLRQASPATTILVDEAYFDYVTNDGHESQIARAVDDPRVIVTRTFSKAYGMAGLRIGFAVAHPDTIKAIQAWESFEFNISFPAMTGALAACQMDGAIIAAERARNLEARTFTRDFFHTGGFTDTESQTNFLFVDTRQPIQTFQAACAARGVRIGRPFPPLTTHARISIGTLEEMKRATAVFAQVLGVTRAAAAA